MDRIFAALFCFVALLASPAVHAGVVDEIKSLVEAGQSAEAYALGGQHPQHLGEPLFDFYFGVAATNAGHATEGVLALERYVLRFPENRVARLELARACFVLGDDQRAREEFAKALQTSQNDAEASTIERFLDAIRGRESRYQPSFSGFAELGIGHDSNVNGGVSNAAITLPVLGAVTVLPGGVKRDDSFSSFAAGVQGGYPVAPGVFLVGGANANAKLHATQDTVDQLSYSGFGGVSVFAHKNSFSVFATSESLAVDNNRYRHVAAISGNFSRQIDEMQSVSLGVQLGDIRYNGSNSVRDAALQSVLLGWRLALIHPLQPVISLQANWGNEDNERRRSDLGRDYWGVRAALSITPAPRWGLSAGFAWTESDYAGPDPTLSTTRRDSYRAVDFSASYRFDRNWSLRGSIIVSENDSNIQLYDYDRNMVEARLRYNF